MVILSSSPLLGEIHWSLSTKDLQMFYRFFFKVKKFPSNLSFSGSICWMILNYYKNNFLIQLTIHFLFQSEILQIIFIDFGMLNWPCTFGINLSYNCNSFQTLLYCFVKQLYTVFMRENYLLYFCNIFVILFLFICLFLIKLALAS